MELTTVSESARVNKFGTDAFGVSAGQRLTIETSPGGAEVLDVEVPTGKLWAVRVIVEIVETDA